MNRRLETAFGVSQKIVRFELSDILRVVQFCFHFSVC
jgi:hypothetical protein